MCIMRHSQTRSSRTVRGISRLKPWGSADVKGGKRANPLASSPPKDTPSVSTVPGPSDSIESVEIIEKHDPASSTPSQYVMALENDHNESATASDEALDHESRPKKESGTKSLFTEMVEQARKEEQTGVVCRLKGDEESMPPQHKSKCPQVWLAEVLIISREGRPASQLKRTELDLSSALSKGTKMSKDEQTWFGNAFPDPSKPDPSKRARSRTTRL